MIKLCLQLLNSFQARQGTRSRSSPGQDARAADERRLSSFFISPTSLKRLPRFRSAQSVPKSSVHCILQPSQPRQLEESLVGTATTADLKMDHLSTPTTSEELFTAGDMTAETVISELNLFSKCLMVSKLSTDTFCACCGQKMNDLRH